MRIGIDLGRTIVDRDNGNTPFADCFPVTKLIIEKFGADNVFIVSRVNSEQKESAIKWLNLWNFYHNTGLKPDNVYFCFERRDKAIFSKGLKLNVFIDDRLDCLAPMPDNVQKLLFRSKDIGEATNLTRISSWLEIKDLLKL